MPHFCGIFSFMIEPDCAAITPAILTDNFNFETDNKHVTYSEFRGFSIVGDTQYILVLNYLDTSERALDFIEFEKFRVFLIKKRFEKQFGC